MTKPPLESTEVGRASRRDILPANTDDPRFASPTVDSPAAYAEWTATGAVCANVTAPLDLPDLADDNPQFLVQVAGELLAFLASALLHT